MEDHYENLGVGASASLQEIKNAFKKKSFHAHPDRHPGNSKAFSQFNKINESFWEIIKYLKQKAQEDDINDPEVEKTLRKCAEYAPGNVDIKGNGMALTIEDHKLWRKALKMTFPSAVVGNQRRNSITALKNQFSKGGSGIRFIIRFKIKGNDEFLLKTTVSVYDTDILVVSGASYYIWILEHFKELKKLVETIKQEKAARDLQEDEDESVSTVPVSENSCCSGHEKMLDVVEKVSVQLKTLSTRLEIIENTQQIILEKINDVSLFGVGDGEEKIQRRQSIGGKTYLVGDDRFADLKAWFEIFMEDKLKGILEI